MHCVFTVLIQQLTMYSQVCTEPSSPHFSMILPATVTVIAAV